MNTQNPQTPPPPAAPVVQKKKLPGWAKFLIVIAILGVVGLTIVGIGLRILAGFLTSKGGEYLTEQGIERGIEKIMEKGMEQAGMGEKPKLDITKDGLVLKDEATGQQIAIQANQQLPTGFPQDIPVYSPSQVTASMTMGPMTMVTLESPSSVADISNFYQRELAAKGWTSSFTAPFSGDNFTGVYAKGNLRLTVSANAEGEKTAIMLSYGADQP